MSEIILPGSNPGEVFEIKPIEQIAEPTLQSDEDKASQLPEPSGYRILCAIPEVEKEYESGIIKPDMAVKTEELLSTVFFVVALGTDCYQDKARFPNGPWCKVGDFILARPNTGTRVKIHGREFRVINDDSVEAIVQDPRGISRA